MKSDTLSIYNDLAGTLSQSRLLHTMGVADTASLLASVYEENPDVLYLCGLLHDCAKNFENQRNIELILSAGKEITAYEYANPALLHAKAGAVWAASHFHIEDSDILHAIEVHTTGCDHMNLIDKILFVADYIEPGRDQAPRLDRLRKLAFSDLDQCCIFILEDTIQYLKQLNKTVDPTTQKTYHALIRQTGKHETI